MSEQGKLTLFLDSGLLSLDIPKYEYDEEYVAFAEGVIAVVSEMGLAVKTPTTSEDD